LFSPFLGGLFRHLLSAVESDLLEFGEFGDAAAQDEVRLRAGTIY
jgi:hypothetical protein